MLSGKQSDGLAGDFCKGQISTGEDFANAFRNVGCWFIQRIGAQGDLGRLLRNGDSLNDTEGLSPFGDFGL